MRRWVLVLVAAALAGILAGTVAHLALPGAEQTEPPPGTPSASPTPKPTATPSASDSKSPSASDSAAPFTNKALLQTDEFRRYGWGSATVTDSYQTPPDTDLTGCGGFTDDEPGLAAAYGASYRGEQSTAHEVVARFDSVAEAKQKSEELHQSAADCSGVGSRQDIPGVENGHWWPRTVGDTRGVVAVCRDGDRLLVLSVTSETSDPVQTTQIPELLRRATERLN